MHAALNSEELAIITQLTNAGMPVHCATLAVVMVTREHARPEIELADVVRQYQGLERQDIARSALSYLKSEGWLTDVRIYGICLVKKADDLENRIAQRLNAPSLETDLINMRRLPCGEVKILGPMNDRSIYLSYLNLLRSAQHEICLPMLVTSPNLLSIPILQERARTGVKVRILLGSGGLVSRLRGGTTKGMHSDVVNGWKHHFHCYRSVEIRLMHTFSGSFLATCMLIDSNLLRFDIYDPETQRSLDGVMLEVTAPSGISPNIIRLFKKEFEEVWAGAESTGCLGRLRWWMRNAWQWWLFCIFLLLTAATAKSTSRAYLSGVCGSVAATFLVNGLVSSWSSIKSFLNRMAE